MQARIFRPAKNAMQSGPAGHAKVWVLQSEPQAPKRPDHLMGWLGSNDTSQQVRLEFHTAEQAVAYAKRHHLEYQLQPEPKAPLRLKNYADNFKSDRLEFGRF